MGSIVGHARKPIVGHGSRNHLMSREHASGSGSLEARFGEPRNKYLHFLVPKGLASSDVASLDASIARGW